MRVIVRDLGTTENHARIERKIGLDHLFAKGVQDARRFIYGTVAVVKDTGRVSLLTGDLKPPSRGRAPTHCGRVLAVFVDDRTFKSECNIASFGERDHIGARDGDRLAHALLVAGKNNMDRGVVQRANTLQRTQGLDHDNVATLHIGDALTAHRIALAVPKLHRTIFFEHSVEVADEQQPLTLIALAGGDQMASTLHRWRHLCPACSKSQLVKFSPKHLTDPAYAIRVHGAAIDIDRSFQKL